jgi:hypothetical protein
MRGLLSRPVVRQVLGAALVLKGLAGAAVPRVFLRLSARVWVGPSFEGADALVPRDDAAALYRDASLGTLVAGLAVLVRATRQRRADDWPAPAADVDGIEAAGDGDDASGDGHGADG